MNSIYHNGTYRTRYLFNGKELDTETNLYYYGARYFEPKEILWYGCDPLGEKYPFTSSYVDCNANPVKYVDPDGRKVFFAKGSSPEFQKAFAQAVQYLNEHGAAGMLAELQASDNIYYIQESYYDHFNPNNQTIYWNPNLGLLTTEGVELSPSNLLNHEVDHARRHDQNPEQYFTDRRTEDINYKNKEEKRVIEGSEQETSRKLGEVNDGQVTRRDHGGNPYETVGPTSREWKDDQQ